MRGRGRIGVAEMVQKYRYTLQYTRLLARRPDFPPVEMIGGYRNREKFYDRECVAEFFRTYAARPEQKKFEIAKRNKRARL